MLQQMTSLGRFEVPSRLVTVQMPVTNGVELETPVSEASHDIESLLGRFLGLQLVLFDASSVSHTSSVRYHA